MVNGAPIPATPTCYLFITQGQGSWEKQINCLFCRADIRPCGTTVAEITITSLGRTVRVWFVSADLHREVGKRIAEADEHVRGPAVREHAMG